MTAPNHSEIPNGSDIDALAWLARDAGVCVEIPDPKPDFAAYVRDMRQRAYAWEGV